MSAVHVSLRPVHRTGTSALHQPGPPGGLLAQDTVWRDVCATQRFVYIKTNNKMLSPSVISHIYVYICILCFTYIYKKAHRDGVQVPFAQKWPALHLARVAVLGVSSASFNLCPQRAHILVMKLQLASFVDGCEHELKKKLFMHLYSF